LRELTKCLFRPTRWPAIVYTLEQPAEVEIDEVLIRPASEDF
jgi:hypothetical protein